MKCHSCHLDFDLRLLRPKLLPKCGHSVCSPCLESLKQSSGFKCPVDSIFYPASIDISDNLLIIETIQNGQTESEKMCLRHKKELEIYCIDCSKEVCANCLLFDDHKSHQYEPVSEALRKCEQKMKRFKHQAKELMIHLERFSETEPGLLQLERETIELIRRKFGEFRDELNRSEQASMEKVRSLISEHFSAVKSNRSKLGEILNYQEEMCLSLNQGHIAKTIDGISKFCQTDPRKHKKDVEQKLNLTFDPILYKSVANFCMFGDSKAREETDFQTQDIFSSTPLIKNVRLNPNTMGMKIDSGRMTDSPHMIESKNTKSVLSLSQFGSPSTSSMNRRSFVGLPLSSLSSSLRPNQFQDSMKKSTGLKENEPEQKNFSKLAITDRIHVAAEQILQGKTFTFDLSGIVLTDQVIDQMTPQMRSLHNCKTLKLCTNGLKDNGLRKVLKSIEKLSVEFFFLTNNSLTEGSLEYFLSFSKYNTSLRNVYLTGNSINKTASRVKELVRALESKNIIVAL